MQDIAYNLILCFVMNFNFIELAINVYLKKPKPYLAHVQKLLHFIKLCKLITAMQNGGLSSILNNYNFLSGGGITNPNAVAALAGASGSSLLKSNNLYPSLNKSQISSLWNNGPAAGLMGSIPRGPYGNFSGNQVKVLAIF